MNLLLDTQIFLWLEGDPARLSPAARNACTEVNHVLWLSVASVWEMQIKISLGKLRLGRPLAETVAGQQAANGLRLLPVQLEHALAVGNLPAHHKDPFDRLLIAQARHENWEVVSADAEFRAYPVRVIW